MIWFVEPPSAPIYSRNRQRTTTARFTVATVLFLVAKKVDLRAEIYRTFQLGCGRTVAVSAN